MPSDPCIPGASLVQSFPCDLDSVRDATLGLCSHLREHGLDPEEIGAWELLCTEAGNNAVLHATPADSRRPIRMMAVVTRTAVEVQVTDHTQGFDFPDNPELPDPLSEHGRGLYLMRTLSDGLEYLRGRHENRLILVRNRRRPPAGSAISATRDESLLRAMSEELMACYESLSAIFRFTAEINRGGQDARFIARWLEDLRRVCAADWWVLRVAPPDLSELAAFLSSHAGPLPRVGLQGMDREASVEARALLGRQDIWLEPGMAIAPDDPLHPFGHPHSGLCHPIYVNALPLGVLSIGRRATTAPFTAGQVNIIHTFADFLGIQIHNSRIQEDQLRSRLVDRELEIAAAIQDSLLPTQLPAPAGFHLAGYSASASQVGGDFYDVIEIPGEGLLFAIADVMGKGVPAAMLAAIFRGHLRSRPELASTPAAFLTWLNQSLFKDLDRADMFITAQLAFLNLRNREMCLASAGHCPLLLGGRGQPVRELAPEGPPLGIASDMTWTEQRLVLPQDPRFILFTDGLIESRSEFGTQMGLDRVKACLEDAVRRRSTALEIHASLLALARDFQGNGAATDDLTFLILAPDPAASF